MDHWTGAERAVAVRAFYKNGDSATAAQRIFRQHYQLRRHGRVPPAMAASMAPAMAASMAPSMAAVHRLFGRRIISRNGDI